MKTIVSNLFPSKEVFKIACLRSPAITVLLSFALIGFFNADLRVHAAVIFDWVTVGNPNNPADTTGFGAVGYVYRISKYEVTNSQYVEFLNAVDPSGSNILSLYNSSMGTSNRGGIAFSATGTPGAKYSLRANMANKPVNDVSFFDAMRFVNWLHNGQGSTGTESGVYSIGNGVNETRASGATIFLPSEDEWYKAAYYQPAAEGGDTDNYWLYTTRSNSAPTEASANAIGDISNPGTNVVNYNRGADWNVLDGNVTTVGSAGPLSASFYGTFDQGGNISEWNEAVFTVNSSLSRGVRGGHWGSTSVSVNRGSGTPAVEFDNRIGFRVASLPPVNPVPEPTSIAVFTVFAFGLRAFGRRPVN